MAKNKVTKRAVSAKTPKIKNVSVKNALSQKVVKLTDNLNSLKRKRYFTLIFIVLVLVSLLYLGRSYLFAALVGGHPITRLQLISELEKRGGKEELDSLITKELISQEAKRKGITVSDEEINTEVERIKGIVEAHGGKIWMEDNKPKGSKFVFTLPLS